VAKRLSAETKRRIEILVSEHEAPEVGELLLNEVGNNLPLLGELDEFRLERFRFAVLNVSAGNIEKLKDAIKLAKADWRDLLMAAGFGELETHKSWLPETKENPQT
jgi:hypothetical protein